MTERLDRVSDAELVQKLERLVARDSEAEAELLEHLAEVDSRELYLKLGFSSLYSYCTERLHFSEGVAAHRIRASRAAREFPLVLEKIRLGALHVTGAKLLAPHLTRENHRRFLAKAKHKSKRAIEELIADLTPKPAANPLIRRLPQPGAERRVASAVLSPPSCGGSAPAPAPPPPPAPLGQERFRVQFTADRQLRDRIEELRALLRYRVPDGDLARVFALAIEELLATVKKERFGLGARPKERSQPEARSRHVPATIRRAVFERDGGRCSYVAEDGRRCGETAFLELHHVKAWARFKRHRADEITLRCRGHNRLAARDVFGASHVNRYRSR